jgi:hypothetical protein
MSVPGPFSLAADLLDPLVPPPARPATTWTGRVAEKRAREPLARPRPLEAPDT